MRSFRKRLTSCILLGTFALLLSGCLVRVSPYGYHGKHYRRHHRGGYAHVHGHGCGHAWRHGRWVTVGVEVDL